MLGVPEDLLSLAHYLGEPDHDMSILAEGNVSARADLESFWVKGSGQMMGQMLVAGFSLVRFAPLLDALSSGITDDVEIRGILNSACLDGPPPSTEAFMHAALLGLPGVNYVGHSHPTPLLSLLCLSEAKSWASKRIFPDEVVCCGPAACFIPYVAPGLVLARSIQFEMATFRAQHGIDPKTFWLQNHGLIAVGRTAKEVESACLMSVKAARALLGAFQTGLEIKWMTDEEVAHIFNWPDEHARQKALWGIP